MLSHPETRYAKSGRYNIAYQVTGAGPVDVVFVPGFVSHVEYAWEDPQMNRYFRRLASFARLIIFDKRGTGMSDAVPAQDLPTLEERMDDVRAVMDAAGSRRATLIGASEGGPMCLLFAATYPERTSALVLVNTFARGAWSEDYPWGGTSEQKQALLDRMESGWGTGVLLGAFAPSQANDASARERWARFQRRASSPGAAVALMRMVYEIDVRAVLPAITVPTLVLHRDRDRILPIQGGRHLAQNIRGAKLVQFSSPDHFFWIAPEAELDAIEMFLTGELHGHASDRVLATILFADIAGSTALAAEFGDSRWREVLERFYALARSELQRFRGRELDTAGDGLFAAFDGPARAIRCTEAIRDGARKLGVDVRAGAHTGECQVIDTKLGGITVHIAARIAAQAQPNEIFVSSIVKDLVAGSGIAFEDRGSRELKGIPGQWQLSSVKS
ncbi:MAG: adenylate/guanylate cyclase domain-containing protein [Sinimarinibacterium sp.]|jgi:pimeloyl-ACP methyl ester carboxylesterase